VEPSGHQGRYDRWAHRRVEPRQFVVWWSFYLLAASMISLGSLGFIGYVGFEVFRPAARILLTMSGIGIAVLWPMVRLSQEPPRSPWSAFSLDGFVMVVPALVVLATQSMPWMAGWTPIVAFAIGLSYLVWTIVAAAGLATYFTRLETTVPRWVCMLGFVLLVCAPPLAAMILGPLGLPSQAMDVMLMASPLTAAFEATSDRAWLGVAAHVETRHLLGAALPLMLMISLLPRR
jgi:hypothetical protein